MSQESSQPNALDHADPSLFKQSEGKEAVCCLNRSCYIGSRLFFDLLMLNHLQSCAHI